MNYALQQLPAAQLAPLAAAYAKARRASALRGLALAVLVVAALGLAAWYVDADLFGLIANRERLISYFSRLLTLTDGPHAGHGVWRDPEEWFWGLDHWLRLLGDTLLMAYVGTLAGATVGLLLGLVSAANIVPSRLLRWCVKRLAEFCRTVPDMVFALLFVIAFGLGPLPGVLAIAIHTAGALGKMMSEVVENIDMKPVEGAAAAGASWVKMVRFSVLPQVLPAFLSYALLRFEINVRSAAVLGFVGAGGIGLDLIVAIRRFYYNDVAALLVLIILTVVIIDTATSRLRQRVLGTGGQA
jgi:phosphonate transport system permease protein